MVYIELKFALEGKKTKERERKEKRVKKTPNTLLCHWGQQGRETVWSPAKPLPWAYSPVQWVLTTMMIFHIFP